MQDTTAVKHQDATAVKPPKNHFTPTSIGMPAGSAALVFLLSRYCGLVMLSGLLPHRWRLYGIARMLLIASQFYHVSPIFADGNVMFIQS